MRSMEIALLDKGLCAEVRGVDLSQPVAPQLFHDIRDALHRHAVLLVRGQSIPPAMQIAFCRRLGPPRVPALSQYSLPGYPPLQLISNIVENGRVIGIQDAGTLWHTDGAYLAEPDMYTQLFAKEVPLADDGTALGDTYFTNTALAYEALPGDIQARIANRAAVHSFPYYYDTLRASGKLKRAELTAEQKASSPDVIHPMVRTHPVTGRKCLFVNESFTRAIIGMDEAQSAPLLALLFAHLKDPRFIYRHRWCVGDVLTWDNCATQHIATFDYGTRRRLMHRVGITGGVPV
jgi:taurine dioxygenase